MNAKPKISVVLPAFKRASELPRSIHLLLSQRFLDLERIIADEASSDNAEKIINHINHGYVRYIKLLNYMRNSKARNVGIREAS